MSRLLLSAIPRQTASALFLGPIRPAARHLHSSWARTHENPLGLPKTGADGPGIPRMSRGLPVRRRIANVGKVLLVSSAKGGVGKSTVLVNVALALRKLGKRCGVLDVDIFGPSIPKLLRLQGEPRLSSSGKLIPLSNYGLPSMSMGYLVAPESPVVWRGLMVMKALQQLLFEVEWPALDYLVIDMPPGTGDTQLTISQLVKVDGALIVSTPQDIALIDAVKGIAMFEKVSIPILGLVQNMSHFVCPNCHHEAHIFGLDGARRAALEHGLDVLGSIPLHETICVQSDLGVPVVVAGGDPLILEPYIGIGRKVVEKLG
ncbi:P-loop containing nucleoside triphosphate hydrolase protein [Metschnikowia bicuspidata var. bicuspidata NRRL YB-4993]|uniref:p-loop containing nucleoside triphosphate hydrolase protein n=1 Tax=Metschnikowia bicuspidata var. bicuspidata NRRL YB-4993 TaxID=869754 RepID=A0A1A0HHE6_9ASCO|nr:P-loop containing nucleoside triphosphate hydrolase protein [Metschnikowia bicuspidata var. bicuspidata NRRL YB-4993]OBA23297.1 P-loop containing nucleoside triphosphate hydrolase protein [Metschnikowia bicuspidata var. bicuspidata NRRL YB-4993]